MIKFLFASCKDANMRYASGLNVLDNFFLLEKNAKKRIFLDNRNFGILKKSQQVALNPQLINSLEKEVKKNKDKTLRINKLAKAILNKYCHKQEKIFVDFNFAFGMGDYLQKKGFKIEFKQELYPKRQFKTKSELKKIQQTLKINFKAFELIKKILADSKIKGQKIVYKNQILTCEKLKLEVEKLFLRFDLRNQEGIIIATGKQTAVPHHQGQGIVKPNQPIICDIFPKSQKTGYFADITRTFVKGKPSGRILKMQKAVLEAQKQAIKLIKPGVKAGKIYLKCEEILSKHGFETKDDQGFIHSAGHGVGLDIHEKPILAKNSKDILAPGQVITLEPGLYYKNIGGVRVEDMLVVKNPPCRSLRQREDDDRDP
ncbi:MAG: M24 family metallopeptidase [Candidatus Moranbacteria bacterium]|nr:M24 family metallopeptidase [Candidatus Moranbacteria bacterium]